VRLSDATPEQMARELMRREIDFMMIVANENDFEVYSPVRIRGVSDRATGNLFSMIRDYLDSLEDLLVD
jgi:hypothetical protein